MDLDVVRVFADHQGNFGNPLGVVSAAAAISDHGAQQIAATLGFAETIFIDDAEAGSIRIYTPATRLPFAGHPTVGAAWFLHQSGRRVQTLATDAGRVQVEASFAGAAVFATADMCPPWTLVQCENPAEVDAALPGLESRNDYLWAWVDEPAGLVRARCFATDLGVVEDEATGSAAIVLAATLGRRIEIRQGLGSVLVAEPVDGAVRLSGRVLTDQELGADAYVRLDV